MGLRSRSRSFSKKVSALTFSLTKIVSVSASLPLRPMPAIKYDLHDVLTFLSEKKKVEKKLKNPQDF